MDSRDRTTGSDPTADLRAFLDAAPSPFHAAAEVARRLTATGSTEAPADSTPSGPAATRGHTVVDGAVIAWVSNADGPPSGFDIAGAHRLVKRLRKCWRYLAMRLGEEYYVNMVGTFGEGSAGYWWSRLYAAIHR
ncbi:MAG: hypothetical protein ACPGSH_04070, partial [Ilumatobacteraceae bacterium]